MQPQSSSQETRLHFVEYWRVIKSRWMFVLLVFLLVMLVTSVVTYLQPRLYTAAARIKVEYERPTVSVVDQNKYPLYDPFFLQTQYEVIQSQKILYEVIRHLNLTRLWGTPNADLSVDLAFQRLKYMLSVRRYRDTSLIEIAVTGTERQLAADIANTITEVFESERLDVKREETLKGINKLREELVAQLERRNRAQNEVERLRKEYNVPVFGDVKLSDLTIQHLQERLTQARTETAGREARLTELKKLNRNQLRNAIATVITDTAVQNLMQELTQSELRLEVMKQDYGPDHPNVRAEQANLEKLNAQVDERLEGVLRGFEVEYQVAKKQAEDLSNQLDTVKNQSLSLDSEKYRPFRNAQREEEEETKLYESLKQRVQQESVELELPRSPVELLDRAEPPRFPVKPNMQLNLALGAVAGLVLGITLAFFIEFLDTSVKRLEDVERYLDLPVLGVIPQKAGSVPRGEATAGDIEAYRMLRTNLEFAKGKEPIVSICAVSAAPGEGKSFTVANLACICAQHGVRVLVVDVDLRRPTQHKQFNVANEFGLADYLVGERSLEQVLVPTTVPNVCVIPAGSGRHARNALPLLTSPRMIDLIRTLGQQFGLVLYDTPPILGVSEASALVRDVGASFLVIQHRRYPRHMARRARQVLDHAGGKLLGVVVNNVAVSQTETYFYYHQQYEDYLQAPELRAAAENRPPPAAKSGGKPGAPEDEIQLTQKY